MELNKEALEHLIETDLAARNGNWDSIETNLNSIDADLSSINTNIAQKLNASDIGANLRLVQSYSSLGGTLATVAGRVYLVVGLSSSSPGNAYVGFIIAFGTGNNVIDVYKGVYASVVASSTDVVFSNSGGYTTNWRIYSI